MAKLELGPHEEAFPIRPVGIRYRCELCGEGEQIADSHQTISVPLGGPKPMIVHHCNKCGGEMLLPKTYPYVSWEVDYD